MDDELVALRAALVVSHEETAELRNLRAFRDEWYADDLPSMQRLARWLDPDGDKPLPTLRRLVAAAIARAEAAEAELASTREALAAFADVIRRGGSTKELLAVRDRARVLLAGHGDPKQERPDG